jgi:hypothetical protein
MMQVDTKNNADLLNPVRALCNKKHRLAAIVTSTVVDRALMVIVNGYTHDSNEQTSPEYSIVVASKTYRYLQ